jgi:glycosyltransferase involved in cell wall biosynthesis
VRVLHVITRLILGGAQENTLLTVEGLLREPGVEVVLVTGPALGPEGELFHRAAEHRVPVQVVEEMRREIHPGRDLASFFRLVSLMRRFRPDVVHTHSSKAGIIGRAAARAANVPVIVHTIHGLPFHPYETRLNNLLFVALERTAARWTTALISVADAMTRQALAAAVGRPEQYVTIYSGIEVEPFLAVRGRRAECRRQLGLPTEGAVLSKVARLAPLKGHEDVLRALPAVVERVPDLTVVFAGDGSLRAQLEKLAAELGLAGRVRFLGLVPPRRIPTIVGASNAVVHASYREGLARVLPQALLAGVPVVSYDVDGAGEALQTGEGGVLVSPGDIRALAAGLTDVLSDPERWQASARARGDLITERFRTETMVAQILALYRRLLAARRP